jgi:hypothetical protein
MTGREALVLMPENELLGLVADIAKPLYEVGDFPNGFSQLVTGSAQYRITMLRNRIILTDELTDAEKAIRIQELEDEYDPFSGENLAGTALYQHNRYAKEKEDFPKEGTPEFDELVNKMDELGKVLRVLFNKIGLVELTKGLWSIQKKWKETNEQD